MNFLNRIMLSTMRNTKRTITLLLFSFCLGISISVVLTINSSINQLKPSSRPPLPFRAILTPISSTDFYQTRIEQNEFIASTIEEISSFPYVQYYSYSQPPTILHSESILMNSHGQLSRAFTFSDSLTNYDSFVNDNREIVSGRFFQYHDFDINDEKRHSMAIVSEPFAANNNLTIGDIINFNLFHSTRIDNIVNHEYSFKIVSIFRQKFDETLEPELNLILTSSLNTIMIPSAMIELIHTDIDNQNCNYFSYAVLTHLIGNCVDGQFYPLPPSFHFILDSIRELEVFRYDIENLIPDGWILNELGQPFNPITVAAESLSEFANFFTHFAIILGIVIFILVMISLFTRKDELTIYIALGESRLNIIKQISVEHIIIIVAPLATVLVIGNIVVNQFASLLVYNSITSTLQSYADTIIFSPFDGLTAQDMLAIFNFDLSTAILFQYVLMSILVIALIICISWFYISKISPKKLLR